jgi:hypothetical protein
MRKNNFETYIFRNDFNCFFAPGMLTVPKGPTGGIINDVQMRNISDTGLAGPDKGRGVTT